MHPRERRSTRRRFLLASAGALAAAPALARAGTALGAPEGVPLGPGGIPLARRSRPVTLPIYHDNEPVDSGASPEKGPLQVFTWSAYVNPTVIKAFEKQYKVAVTLTSSRTRRRRSRS
jgi:spermidine/putrescine-binding protein